jgi:hypothetical protein
MKDTEPKLIPKGAFSAPGEIPQAEPERATIVDDKPDAAKEAVVRAKKLALQVENLTAKVSELSEENHTLKSKANDYDALKKELEQARSALSDSREGTVERQIRRFELMRSLLTGFASNGKLFGNDVREEQVNNIVKHSVGLAIRAEDEATKRGF